jgi:hypothetical protein
LRGRGVGFCSGEDPAAVVMFSVHDRKSKMVLGYTTGGSQQHIPKRWEEQIRTAPLGRRRVLQR